MSDTKEWLSTTAIFANSTVPPELLDLKEWQGISLRAQVILVVEIYDKSDNPQLQRVEGMSFQS